MQILLLWSIMNEEEIRGMDLHCLKCLRRFTEELRPVVKYCRHLACHSCNNLASFCELCGDLRGREPVPDAAKLSAGVLAAAQLFAKLDTPQSVAQRGALLQALANQLAEIEDGVRFNGVPCVGGKTCRNVHCRFSHDPLAPLPVSFVFPTHPGSGDSSISSSAGLQRGSYLPADSALSDSQESLQHMNLEPDRCERCRETRRTTLVPFCVSCGYINPSDILQGKSLQDPLNHDASSFPQP